MKLETTPMSRRRLLDAGEPIYSNDVEALVCDMEKLLGLLGRYQKLDVIDYDAPPGESPDLRRLKKETRSILASQEDPSDAD